METAVLDIKSWMTQNKLQLNDGKTEVLLIRSQFMRIPRPIDSINIGSCSVDLVNYARNIGVTFDDKHTLRKHITITCNSIYYNLRKIGRIRRYLTSEACENLVHALVSCKLDYCNGLLYGLASKDITHLQHAQNTAARIVSRRKKSDHISPVLKDLHWLPVYYRIHYKILLMTYKALNNAAPSYISDLISYKHAPRVLRSNNKGLLHIPPCKLKSYGERAFSRAAPQLWNSLPVALRQSPTLDKFRKDVKTHLFMRAF
ncbi:uncharacterized protein LOC144448062 [Glandiceps talaboti]